MTAYWNRLGLGSKAALIGLPVLIALGFALTLLVAVGLGPLLNFLGANLWLVRFIVAATLVIVTTIPTAFVIIYMELKVIARMNLRVGPDRVGPFGAAQSVIHGLKVLSKEDFAPTGVDVPIFTLAPVVVFLATIMTLMVVPFAPGVVGQDGTISLLYFFAIGGMAVVGLMMAGWASFNKYSLLGAIRAAAQAISYELPLTLSVVGVLILAGTMSMSSIVIQQGGPWLERVGGNLVQHAGGSFLDWNIFKQPLGFIIFFIAGTAEANRTPLDMTEADQELVGGFATEYSGMRFGFFFFAEYVNVFVISAVMTVLFFGGWNAPITLPFTVSLPLDPASLGFPLVILLTLGPVAGTVVCALPFWLLHSGTSTIRALVYGFILLNVILVGLIGLWAYISFDWVAGLIWTMVKTYAFVFIFVQMRATLPRVRVDQLMSFAWKWLLPASLLNIFATAMAVAIIAAMK